MNPMHLPEFRWNSARRYQCYLTGNGRLPSDPGIIATGIEIEGEGMLDISYHAVRHLAGMIGWESPEAVETREARMRADLELAEAVRDDAVAQFQALEAVAKRTEASFKRELKAATVEMQVKRDQALARVAELEQQLELLQAGGEVPEHLPTEGASL